MKQVSISATVANFAGFQLTISYLCEKNHTFKKISAERKVYISKISCKKLTNFANFQ